MNIIGKDQSIPQEKQNSHDSRWGDFVASLIKTKVVCPNDGCPLLASMNLDADLYCIACGNKYIVVGENQLERIDDGLILEDEN